MRPTGWCSAFALAVVTILAAAATLWLPGAIESALAQTGPFGVPRPKAPPPPADGVIGWIFAKQAEFYRELISRTLVEPKVAPEEVKDLPFEDIELLAALATRQRDVDALGQHIAGLDDNEKWRRFRGIDYLD